MELVKYFRSLSDDEKESYAKRCGTTANYLTCHIMGKVPRKMPRKPLRENLYKESNGMVSKEEVMAHLINAGRTTK